MPLLRSFLNFDTVAINIGLLRSRFSALSKIYLSAEQKAAASEGHRADTGRAGARPNVPTARVRMPNTWRDARLDNHCES
jgi:hypothetical protein